MLTGGGKDYKDLFSYLFIKNLEAEVMTGTKLSSISLDLQSPPRLNPLRTCELKATCTEIQLYT